MGILLHYRLYPVQYLPVGSPLPYGQNHGFPQEALCGVLFQNAHSTVNLHRPLRCFYGDLCGPVFGHVRKESESMVAGRVSGFLQIYLIQGFHRLPCEGESLPYFPAHILELPVEEWLFVYVFSEGEPLSGKCVCLHPRPVGKGNAPYTVGNPRYVQALQYQIDAPFSLSQHVCFGVFQFHLTRRNGPGPDLGLYPAHMVIQGAIPPVFRKEKESKAPDTQGLPLYPGSNDSHLRPHIAGEVLLSVENPESIPRRLGDGLHSIAQVGAPLRLRHPCGSLPYFAIPGDERRKILLLQFLRTVLVQGNGRGNGDRIWAIDTGVVEGCDVSEYVEGLQALLLECPRNHTRPVALKQHVPVFGWIKEFIYPVAPPVEHPQLHSPHPVDGFGDELSFSLPPVLVVQSLPVHLYSKFLEKFRCSFGYHGVYILKFCDSPFA